jgi:hypothetical protein
MGAHVKGTAFLGTTRFLKETFGEQGFQKIAERLSPEERERVQAPMLPSAWYPLSLLVAVMRAAKAEFGGTMPDIYREIGRASADYSLTTVYSLVFKVGSTQWIISRATAVFSSYYDTGKMVVSENGKGSATLEISDFSEPAPELCERIAGWCVRTLEHCGAKWARMEHPQCRCRGDGTCVFKATWQ